MSYLIKKYDTNKVIEIVNKAFKGYEKLYEYLVWKGGEIVVFGGVPRDLIFFNQRKIRDIDLVVTGLSNDQLNKIFKYTVSRRNRFGGLQCIFRKSHVDIWSLSETWAFKKGYFKPRVRSLPKTVFLSTDSLLVSMKTKELIEERFIKSFESKTISIVLKENPFPSLCVIRALINRKKYDFRFSEDLVYYIRSFFHDNENPWEELHKIQSTHYGEIKLTTEEIIYELQHYV